MNKVVKLFKVIQRLGSSPIIGKYYEKDYIKNILEDEKLKHIATILGKK